ncbi:iron-sulfur cluster biosynthesis family protein [Salipaludibacillus sp. LMS25]|jgi:uncharacterized protein YqkB|uniref:iron-sulfur cluster biosynthesis family protein n=1 Tax=Salipaludibacillus sp. LMS25 TaxID=2924031 RepID=UPI0020D0DA9D|nr:iron-sulfur cluster biosynthesis family protein [Salipaludibacillus sp. LMS25]UTR14419.1 iron-sulfur cluster biosynthesis family protein [Salipaludibacillus sp. LMS25]
MKLELSPAAVKQLKNEGKSVEANILFLQYETDGCGCVVSGVPKLIELSPVKITKDKDISIIETEPAPYRAAIEKRVEWVYDDKLMIDYSSSVNMFQLKSPNQMINPRLTFESLK